MDGWRPLQSSTFNDMIADNTESFLALDSSSLPQQRREVTVGTVLPTSLSASEI